MADTTFKLKRGLSGGASPSGLTHGELAVNTTDNRLFVGSITGSVNAVNNRFFTGTTTPSYPIEGDRWYTGTIEKFYYNNSWVNAGGASGSSGSFDPTQLLIFNSGASGSGGATFAGGTRFYGGTIVQSGGLSVTGGATITGGVALYGNVTVNGAPIGSGGSVPLASATVTGVASFGNQFVVSATGAVSLTSNYVTSVNGMTGPVTLTLAGSVPLASSSVTGVASFGNQFVVSATGAVSLTSNYVISVNGITGTVTGIAITGSNTFLGLQSLNAGLTTNHLYVSNGATFAGTNGIFLAMNASNPLGTTGLSLASDSSAAGALRITTPGGYVTIGPYNTAYSHFVTDRTTYYFNRPLQINQASGQSTIAGYDPTLPFTIGTPVTVAGGIANRITVLTGSDSSTGGYVGIGTTTPQTKLDVNGDTTVRGFLNVTGGITSNHLYVTNGVTFAGTSVYTGLGTFNAGITSNHLYVTNGVTFGNGLVVQAGGISITGGATLTGGVVVYGGLNVSTGTITGTLATAAQPNITSVGTLTRLDVGSGGISSAGGITGTLNTAAQPNITSVGTLTSLTASGLGVFNAGITSNHLYVSNGVTFAGTSVHTGLGIFNAGITSNHLYVSNGVTFANGLVVQAGGISITGGATLTGGVAIYGGLNVSSGTITGTLATAAQTNITSVGTLTRLDVGSGGISSAGGITGTLNTAAQPNITSVGTLTRLDVGSGGISSAGGITGTLNTAAQPNITSVGTLTRLDVGSGGISSAGGITGTLNTVAQPNITSVGTLTSLSSSGLVTASGGITSNHLYVSNGATFANGLVVQAGGISITGGATLTGGVAVYGGLNVSSGTISGTLATAAQPNITSVGTLTRLEVGSGGISSAGGITGTINTAAQPNITSIGTLTRLEVGSGGISSAGGITGTINTAAQPNITSIGTLTSLSSSGLVTASGGITSNHLYVTNGVTFAGTSVHTGLGTFNAGITSTHLHVSNGATFAGTVSATLSTIAQPNITSVGTLTRLDVGSGGISSAGGITGTLNTAAQPNITSVGTLTSLSSSGLVTASGGITSNHLYVTNGVTFAGTSVHTGLGTFNAGITSTHLHVSNGATFAGTVSATLSTIAQPNITSVGTLTRLDVGLGGISSAGGITGTLNTATQTNITSVGTLTSLSSSGLVTASGGITSNHLYVTNGVTFASTSVHTGLGTFNAGITSNHLYVTNGVTFAGTSVHTGLGTFNAGITSNHLYVTSGATFAGTNGIFLAMNGSNPLGTTGLSLASDSSAAGALRITTPGGYVTIGPFTTLYSHFVTDRDKFYFNRPVQINQASGQSTLGSYSLTDPFTIGTPNVTNGTLISRITVLTGPDERTSGYVGIGTTTPQAKLDVNGDTTVRGFLNVTGGMSVTGGTAYFYRDVYLATAANHPGIVDYEFAANTGVTYPSASTPAYTVGDKWSNGSIEYTWNGSAWIENTDNIVSSSPIAFDSIVPSQSITPSKLSLGGPSWINGSSFTTNQSELLIKGSAVQPSLVFKTNADALVGNIQGDSDSLRLYHTIQGTPPLLTLVGPAGAGVTSSVTIGGNLLVTYGNNSNGFGANVNIAGNLQCTGNASIGGTLSIGTGYVVTYATSSNGRIGDIALVSFSSSSDQSGMYKNVTSSSGGPVATSSIATPIVEGGGTVTWSNLANFCRPSAGTWTMLVAGEPSNGSVGYRINSAVCIRTG
jgi:hypothetical protein